MTLHHVSLSTFGMMVADSIRGRSSLQTDELTNNEVLQNFQDIHLSLFMTAKEIVPNTSTKLLAAKLVCPLHLPIGQVLLDSIFLPESCAPERKLVSVNGIVCASTDQSEGGNVFVGI